MPGAPVQLALLAAAVEPHHSDAVIGLFDPIHFGYEAFAMESIEVASQGSTDFGKTHKYKLLNHAEYVAGGYLEVTFPELDISSMNTGVPQYKIQWIHNIGIYVYDELSFLVNNNTLDKQPAEFIDMWSRLSLPEGKRKGWNDMIGEVNLYSKQGNIDNVYSNQVDTKIPQHAAAIKTQFVTILPLNFWWTQDWTQALPTGVLVFCDLWIHAKVKQPHQLYKMWKAAGVGDWANYYGGNVLQDLSLRTPTTPRLVDAKLYIDYVYLPNKARNRIANEEHFYVIKQTKFGGSHSVSGTSTTYKLPWVLPVTTILFAIREDAAETNLDYHWFDRFSDNNDLCPAVVFGAGAWTAGLYNMPDTPISTATIRILADERQSARSYLYHTKYQPLKHNTAIPESNGIWAYNFALRPEDSLSSGVINLSAAEQNNLYIVHNRGTGINGGASGIGSAATGAHNGNTGQLLSYGVSSNYIFIKGGYLTPMYSG